MNGGYGSGADVVPAPVLGHLRAMYRFPPSSELQFLVGAELEQVCLDPWSTQFRFSGGVHITVEGKFEHLDPAGRGQTHQAGDERDVGPVYLQGLLQQRILAAETEPLRLTLTFTDGATLRLHSDEGAYECGQIAAMGDRLIIF